MDGWMDEWDARTKSKFVNDKDGVGILTAAAYCKMLAVQYLRVQYRIPKGKGSAGETPMLPATERHPRFLFPLSP
jgi:hypothetical protein